MTKYKLQVPAVSNFTPGALAGTQFTVDFPLNYRYHEIYFVYTDGGSSPTDFLNLVGDLVAFRNGVPARTHTALEMDHLNGLNGSQYQRQQVGTGAAMRQTQTMFLAEPWRKSKADTDAMAWNVSPANGFKTFQVKGTLIATIPSTATLQVWARVDAVQALPKGVAAQGVRKVYRVQIPASGLSNDVTTLDERDAYQTICLKNPSGAGYVKQATLKKNGVIIFDTVNQQDNVADLTNLGLNPASSQSTGAFGYDIVLDADDPLLSALPLTSQDSLWLHLDYNTAASGNVIALVERIGPLD
ncbi:MAG TPA: hypothetical protein VK742_08320 [Candidatus Sulfotelmatobacter sp.]|jgi:hypothetical protein|nr:hypothetical protein [Candidatus Sulfotelmatobacter sp.]